MKTYRVGKPDDRRCVTSGFRGRQSGSSMVEFVISLLVFVPIFIGIPLLGKYADIKHRTIEASRYVAFERTVYSEPGVSTRYDSWRDSGGQLHPEASKPSSQIMLEAEQRLFGHPSQGFHDPEVRTNPLWVNRKGESLLALAETTNDNPNDPQESVGFLSGQMAQSSATDHISGVANFPAVAVQTVATGGSEFLGIFGNDGDVGDVTGAGQQGNQDLGGVIDVGDDGVDLTSGGGVFSQDGCGFPGINLENGVGLGRNNYAEVNVSTPVINFLKTRDDAPDFNFEARAAVLSNAWTVPSEAKFQERLDNQVPNQFLGCITLPGRYTFGLLSNPFSDGAGFLFGEGKLAYPVRLDPNPSVVLPNELQYYDDTR